MANNGRLQATISRIAEAGSIDPAFVAYTALFFDEYLSCVIKKKQKIEWLESVIHMPTIESAFSAISLQSSDAEYQ